MCIFADYKYNVIIFTVIFITMKDEDVNRMVKIALCDDNSIQLSMVNEIVHSYCKENRVTAQIEVFEDGVKLLEYVEQNGFFDFYILDMIMPELSGAEVAQQLRDKGDTGQIVFLTVTEEYAVRAFDLDALHYLVKPVDYKAIYRVLDKAKMASSKGFLEIRCKGKQLSVKIDDIMCVDIVNRRLCYHMLDGKVHETVMLRKKFSESVAELLEVKGFLMSGTVVINTAHVLEADNESIKMTNGSVYIPSKNVAQSLYEQILELEKKN